MADLPGGGTEQEQAKEFGGGIGQGGGGGGGGGGETGGGGAQPGALTGPGFGTPTGAYPVGSSPTSSAFGIGTTPASRLAGGIVANFTGPVGRAVVGLGNLLGLGNRPSPDAQVTGPFGGGEISSGQAEAGRSLSGVIGTQPGSPSGATSATQLGGASYFGAPGDSFLTGGVVTPQAGQDLSGLPIGGQTTTTAASRTSPWLWLLLLAAAVVAGYFIYRYYKKKKKAAA